MHIICLYVTSITDTGKKFQLANVKDVNYRTEDTPSESENVNNNHAYEYEANGNLVYVITSRTKKNGVTDEKTAERKLKWDEEISTSDGTSSTKRCFMRTFTSRFL